MLLVKNIHAPHLAFDVLCRRDIAVRLHSVAILECRGVGFAQQLADFCRRPDVVRSLATLRVVPWQRAVGIERWRRHYNEERPHMSLGDLTPAEFKIKSQSGCLTEDPVSAVLQ